ncbi:hypothetical protein DH2020_031234 [Rehmannia glutinosa]|uniref:BHLH domain-containing protein n=1 Tax=Rehmannia glutinosa TaxID=99300 RepID=A0ABR0VJ96_REHGL
MALEAVIYQQDPFMYCCTDYNYGFALGEALQEEEQKPNVENLDIINGEHLDSHNTTSSPDTCGAGDGFFSGGPTVAPPCRRKRRRTKSLKNKEEMENQRMTHIAVERNRRRQMNDYLAVLRSLMPPSYAQRGDQASIVGGAINFVKELEQLLQFLEAHKLTNNQNDENQQNNAISKMFSNFFTFPQYSMSPTANSPTTTVTATDAVVEKRSSVAEIEVTMTESHANIKILSRRRPKQLMKMVAWLQSICLTILHLNVTTVDQSVLYSFSVKVEDECRLNTVSEIATAVHDMVEMIQQDDLPEKGLFCQKLDGN